MSGVGKFFFWRLRMKTRYKLLMVLGTIMFLGLIGSSATQQDKPALIATVITPVAPVIPENTVHIRMGRNAGLDGPLFKDVPVGTSALLYTDGDTANVVFNQHINNTTIDWDVQHYLKPGVHTFTIVLSFPPTEPTAPPINYVISLSAGVLDTAHNMGHQVMIDLTPNTIGMVKNTYTFEVEVP